MSKFILYFLVSATSWLFFVCPAFAAQGQWASSEHVRARLLSAIDTAGPQKSFEAALELEMEEGWHIYWRIPGDAGLPPRFDWTSSENVEETSLFWPAPTRNIELDFHTFGYNAPVTFPLQITLSNPSSPTQIKLHLEVMACKDICVPQTLETSLSLEPGDGHDSAMKSVIHSAKKTVPAMENTTTIGIDTIVLGPEALVISTHAANGLENADVFAYVENTPFTIPPVIHIDKNDQTKAMITLPKPYGVADLPAFAAGKMLHITLTSGRHAVEKSQIF